MAAVLRAGDLLVLTGALGAGKTTLTRGIGEGLGTIGTVSSPTFVIARTHQTTSNTNLVHVDAYRLGSVHEFDDLDIDLDNSVVVVEWGRGFAEDLTDDWLDIEIERAKTSDDEMRTVTIETHGSRWNGVIFE